LNSSLEPIDSTYGLHFTTSTSLPANTQIIACPAKLAITRGTALQAFQGLGADGVGLEKLNERQLIAGYVTLHFGYGLEEVKNDVRYVIGDHLVLLAGRFLDGGAKRLKPDDQGCEGQ
jgi:hypothetical protein